LQKTKTYNLKTMNIKTILLALCLAGTSMNVLAAPKGTSVHDSLVIRLWPDGAPHSNGLSGPETDLGNGRIGNVSDPTLIVYRGFYPNGMAIINCPGGGYRRLAMYHEGYDMAEYMNKMGVTYAVLKYRMPNGHTEVPLEDIKQAMRIMKKYASEWGVTTIGVMGSSAGGHLAANLSTHYDADTRPDFQVLLYPAVTDDMPVDSLTPPAFITMSADDRSVPVERPMNYYQRLLKNHVPAALHIYPEGGHGWGYMNSFKYKQEWTGELEKWLRQMIVRKQQSTNDPQQMGWRRVSCFMPEDFYASKDAQDIADRVIFYQAPSGGWTKNINFHFAYTPEEMAKRKSELHGPTIDNESTTQEMKYLAHVYRYKQNRKWRDAFIHGVQYLLDAQYDNGGWPQFYPKKNMDNGLDYSTHITYNDDAMINVMEVLKAIADNDDFYAPLKLTKKLRQQCQEAYDKGVECILATQIRVNGKPTLWCAQHDEKTLAPAPARAFELASFSGSESVGIVRLLMSIPHPKKEIVEAVEGAVEFFRAHEIYDMRTERFHDQEGMWDVRLVPALGNVMWARFYDLDTQKPFFCGRNGIKKNSIFEIERERRAGYGWYTQSPSSILKAYPEWKSKL
jgi:PelA/Pel-15E family pectate lyase